MVWNLSVQTHKLFVKLNFNSIKFNSIIQLYKNSDIQIFNFIENSDIQLRLIRFQ